MVTLIQNQKLDSFPVVALGGAYWQELVEFLTRTLVVEGTISPDDLKLIRIVNSPADAVEYIVNVC